MGSASASLPAMTDAVSPKVVSLARLHGFVDVAELHHRQAGTESLVLHDQHVVGHAGEHGGPHVESAFVRLHFTPGVDGGAFGHGIGQMPPHDRSLRREGEGMNVARRADHRS